MNATLTGCLFEIMATLVLALIGAAGTWLSTKVAKRQELSSIAVAMEQVIQAAQITVGELQQTIVNNLKANGAKLTEEQIRELGGLLLAKVKEKLAASTLSMLETAKVDVEALIRGASEAWISKMKAAVQS